MNLIILIPALACCVVLARISAPKALVNVYLPVLLLFPGYFSLRFPHLPPLTFADAAILPLGAAMLLAEMHRWRWSWMDLWVVLFSLSAALSEGLNTVAANGGLQLFAEITTIILPYMAGKLLIDKNPSPTSRLPLWLRVFPELRVLIALRDPRDVAASLLAASLP